MMIPAALAAHPAFVRFWWARLCGTAAAQMLMVALGWQMYDLTGSAWDLGLVGLAQFMPAVALVLVAGHVIDRHDRRTVVAACYAVQTVVAAVLAAATLGGWVSREWILGLSLLLGAAKAFQLPAQQALTPQLVPAEVLARAMAFSSGGMQAAIIAGPALGGFLYAAGAPVVYGLCAALFVGGVTLRVSLGRQRPAAARTPVTLDALFAGFGFIWRRKAVLG